jgi:hypothetical protein
VASAGRCDEGARGKVSMKLCRSLGHKGVELTFAAGSEIAYHALCLF